MAFKYVSGREASGGLTKENEQGYLAVLVGDQVYLVNDNDLPRPFGEGNGSIPIALKVIDHRRNLLEWIPSEKYQTVEIKKKDVMRNIVRHLGTEYGIVLREDEDIPSDLEEIEA